ncbi:MAG: UTP--glucose-1-phosphate uridylyltransferase, partial [Flavobacteriaceae bacterium]|nr:UTP--glucose-1-phosphate uridylyltransferase [Flavobacteriaceae bacterium]
YPADSLASMNFWICHPDIFDYIETALKQFITNNNNLEKGEVYIPLVLQEYCGANQIPIGVLQCNASWFGITYAPDKEAAKSKLASMQEASVVYPDPLWKQL